MGFADIWGCAGIRKVTALFIRFEIDLNRMMDAGVVVEVKLR